MKISVKIFYIFLYSLTTINIIKGTHTPLYKWEYDSLFNTEKIYQMSMYFLFLP